MADNEGVQVNVVWQGADSRRPLRSRARRRCGSRNCAELVEGPPGRPAQARMFVDAPRCMHRSWYIISGERRGGLAMLIHVSMVWPGTGAAAAVGADLAKGRLHVPSAGNDDAFDDMPQ